MIKAINTLVCAILFATIAQGQYKINWAIEPMFEYAYELQEGWAAAAITFDSVVVIDSNARVRFTVQDDCSVYTFSEGMAALYRSSEEAAIRYIDTTGKIVIGRYFEQVGDFKEGKAAVLRDGLYGYINPKGDYVIPPMFDYAHDFSEGMALVSHSVEQDTKKKKRSKYLDDIPEYKYGFIDPFGILVVAYIYEEAGSFNEGLAMVQYNGKIGYINPSGEMVISPKYSYGHDFSEGLAAVSVQKKAVNKRNFDTGENYKYGFINQQGLMVISPKYTLVSAFSEGLAAANKDDRWGYIDKTGKWVIEAKYEQADDFSQGLAAVQLDGKTGYIDHAGRVVIPFLFREALHFKHGLAPASIGDDYTSDWGYLRHPLR